MIKSFSFIVLTLFFHFNQLKILRQPGYLLFQVKPTIFFTEINELVKEYSNHSVFLNPASSNAAHLRCLNNRTHPIQVMSSTILMS